MAEDLLDVFERGAEVEGVFAWEGLEDGEDVLFCWFGRGGWHLEIRR